MVQTRRELAGRLTEAGMSTRAIAPAVGVSSPQTVVNDLRAAGVQRLDTSTPDPLAEEKADGRVVRVCNLHTLSRRAGHAERADPSGVDPLVGRRGQPTA